jgi:hypothetical protein
MPSFTAQAARRSSRWWSPPTSGNAMTSPTSRSCTCASPELALRENTQLFGCGHWSRLASSSWHPAFLTPALPFASVSKDPQGAETGAVPTASDHPRGLSEEAAAGVGAPPERGGAPARSQRVNHAPLGDGRDLPRTPLRAAHHRSPWAYDPYPVPKSLPERLLAARRRLGISRRELARRPGLDYRASTRRRALDGRGEHDSCEGRTSPSWRLFAAVSAPRASSRSKTLAPEHLPEDSR